MNILELENFTKEYKKDALKKIEELIKLDNLDIELRIAYNELYHIEFKLYNMDTKKYNYYYIDFNLQNEKFSLKYFTDLFRGISKEKSYYELLFRISSEVDYDILNLHEQLLLNKEKILGLFKNPINFKEI